MFSDNSPSTNFSFEQGLPAQSPESEIRHLINRLRLEFRTASQRQLEDSVATALAGGNAPASSEKTLHLARTSLQELLTPQIDKTSAEPSASEPPFRAEVA